MTVDTNSLLLGMATGFALMLVAKADGARRYADALTEGRDTEAGIWAFLWRFANGAS